MDVWVSSVAVFGILGGALAIWYLLRQKMKAEVEKNWHFWTKQVGDLYLDPLRKVGEQLLTFSAGAHCSHWTICSRPTHLPNTQLPGYMGG